jgi:hypothetical protein
MTKQTVAEYVADYEFRGETDYSPTLDERAMIEDAINGFICEQEQARTPAPEWEAVRAALEAKLLEAKINCDGSKISVAYADGVIDTYNAARATLKGKSHD